jgi:hypothetical protein
MPNFTVLVSPPLPLLPESLPHAARSPGLATRAPPTAVFLKKLRRVADIVARADGGIEMPRGAFGWLVMGFLRQSQIRTLHLASLGAAHRHVKSLERRYRTEINSAAEKETWGFV